MKNITAKKKLAKMGRQLYSMRDGLKREYFLEEVWEQCFKAYPEKKTEDDSWYFSEVRISSMLSDVFEELETA
jgi:hypothetical protein